AVKVLEDARTDRAIRETARHVRVHADGSIARTEFSSSTGGWTAGGVFPAVKDDGDATSRNPNHTWSQTMSAADLARRLKLPAGVGVASIRVTGRSGVGDMGGRVTELTWTGTDGVTHRASARPEQDTIRSLLGLKSNWFSVSGFSQAEADALVSALYEDLLGRGVDPTGRATWTGRLMSGTSQTELVNTLTRSDEYINIRVAQAYREVLGRTPDAPGARDWLQWIRAGRYTVDDVQRVFYDTQEYFTRSGGTREGYVARLYETVLRRTASAGEVQQ